MFDDSMKFFGKGGLTKNAELSYNNNGTAFLKFSIGVSKSRKIKGSEEWEQISHYFNCVVIGKYGEKLVNHLKKGTKIYIVGDLEFSKWEKDGIKHNAVNLHVEEIEIIKKPDQDNNNSNNNYNNSSGNNSYNNNSGNNSYNNYPSGNNNSGGNFGNNRDQEKSVYQDNGYDQFGNYIPAYDKSHN